MVWLLTSCLLYQNQGLSHRVHSHSFYMFALALPPLAPFQITLRSTENTEFSFSATMIIKMSHAKERGIIDTIEKPSIPSQLHCKQQIEITQETTASLQCFCYYSEVSAYSSIRDWWQQEDWGPPFWGFCPSSHAAKQSRKTWEGETRNIHPPQKHAAYLSVREGVYLQGN